MSSLNLSPIVNEGMNWNYYDKLQFSRLKFSFNRKNRSNIEKWQTTNLIITKWRNFLEFYVRFSNYQCLFSADCIWLKSSFYRFQFKRRLDLRLDSETANVFEYKSKFSKFERNNFITFKVRIKPIFIHIFTFSLTLLQVFIQNQDIRFIRITMKSLFLIRLQYSIS